MRSIILDYAIERKGEIKTIYKYDFFEALNVITVDEKKLPFIDSTHENILLLTKSKIPQERDDNNIDMLELQTKTDSNREKDDDYNLLLDFQTKTLTQRERDDESFNYN
jgi:outer membrane lipoprotein-sorting protein